MHISDQLGQMAGVSVVNFHNWNKGVQYPTLHSTDFSDGDAVAVVSYTVDASLSETATAPGSASDDVQEPGHFFSSSLVDLSEDAADWEIVSPDGIEVVRRLDQFCNPYSSDSSDDEEENHWY